MQTGIFCEGIRVLYNCYRRKIAEWGLWMRRVLFLILLVAILGLQPEGASMQVVSEVDWMRESLKRAEQALVTKHGEGERARIERGLRQVSSYWRTEDGDAAKFEEFVLANFEADPKRLDAMFERYQRNLEMLDGHMLEISRELRSHSDLDAGEVLPFDEAFAAYDPAAHLQEDLFRNKLAFTVLLNFPLTSLEEKNAAAGKWTRRQWAEARLADRFAKRVPAEVNQQLAQARAAADNYISDYNIWMHHLVDSSGRRLFQPGLRLLSHWNLRDEIKARYSEKDGVEKQRMIQQVMERIVTQTIPQAVINNPAVDWNPFTNEVWPAAVKDSELVKSISINNTPEPNTRYKLWLDNFKAERALDRYSPSAPTLMARRFNEDRELSEARVRAMLEQVVSSPLVPKIAALIQERLGRPLEPFDIWYSGFLPRSSYTEAQLDEICRKKYPDAAAYSKDMPRLLEGLGFAKDRAEFLASRIVVDPARGSGHAQGAGMREGKAHLRTRVEKDGMNYKGYNIAVHEMGHNVEQVFSMSRIDYTLLQGVPNTAFTEALAFVFQHRDLELLGLERPDEEGRALKVLNDFWATYEISGVALVDMEAWHWLYKHPEATPAEFRDAVISISKEVWNKYYAGVLGRRDQVLLGIYSHMINETLYLPDYPIGHLIAFQIEEHIGKTKVGSEFERMALLGRLTPDYWMQQATGAPVGAEALLKSAAKALEYVTKKEGDMKRLEVATLGGGCFWCLEAVFDELQGVESVESGYAGGRIPNPTYEQVCTGMTGHAEVVQIKFDPEEVSFKEILQVFFTIHDPTQLNRQGADVGTQYRSVIFYHDPEQRQVAESLIKEMTEAGIWDSQIVTEVAPLDVFYKAEEYHQKYFAKNPTQGYCQFVVSPKVQKFRKYYKERLKQK